MNRVLAGLLIVAAAVSGAFLGPEIAAVFPVVLFVILGAVALQRGLTMSSSGSSAVPASVEEPEQAEPQGYSLFVWGAVSVLVHWMAAVLLNGTSLWLSFAPDAVYYETTGAAIAQSWSDSTVDLTYWFGDTHATKFYPYVNAAVYWVFGTSRWPMSLLNGVVSVLAAGVIGQLARDMYGAKAGRRAFLLCAFFPSMITWTSMNIREAWSFLLLALLVRSAYHLRRRFQVQDFVFLLGCLMLLGYVRVYLVPLLVIAVLVSLFVVRRSQIPYALVGLGVMGVLIAVVGDSLGVSVDAVSTERLAEVQTMRENLAFGGSAYGKGYDTTTLGGALLYLPQGILQFLLAPFPWAISSWRQALALPECFVLYVFLFQAVRGAWVALRSDAAKAVLPAAIIILITGAYALVSGNEGTAYRHRAQVLLFIFIFAAYDQTRRAGTKRSAVKGIHAHPGRVGLS